MTPQGASRPAPLGLRDRLLGLRDRILSSQRFQRAAARFPLTRPIATAEASALFDITAGFVYAQVLSAAVKLDLFAILAEAPATAAALSARTGLPPAGMERLLAAAATLRLTERRSNDRWGLGRRGAALLGNPGLAEMIAHHDLFYRDLADPLALLSGARPETELGRFWPYARRAAGDRPAEDDVAAYSRLMAASQGFVAEDVLDAVPLSRIRRLMDVGGGDGTFLRRAAARAPGLHVTLFDLPPVAEIARARFAAAGLGDRADAVGGSFRDQALPVGADAISIVRVAHDHDDDVVLDLFAKARAALPRDGMLIVAEPMADTPGAERMGEAYFGFYLLAMGSGRPRSAAELAALLGRAGFASVRPVRTARPMLAGVLLARPNPD
ncbi:methyltransferase [Prosthecomicrobium sp. N25]|uniref:methyltransferase n=1 Tax=Prosthecomicrobium sp. N25 TaxID=3129254 RepID=UPI00307758AB